MERPAAELVNDLSTYVRQQMTVRDMCRKEDYPEDGFNEVIETVSGNLMNALSKLNATQEAMGKQVKEMKTQMSNQNRQEASTSAQQPTKKSVRK